MELTTRSMYTPECGVPFSSCITHSDDLLNKPTRRSSCGAFNKGFKSNTRTEIMKALIGQLNGKQKPSQFQTGS
jgi:hypothetical protein